MTEKLRRLLPVVLLLAAACAAHAQTKPPGFSAQLLAESESVQPGARLQLAVVLDVEKPWHIYHPILLDTGFATSIDFDLPAGVGIGELHFPTPFLGELTEIEYLAFEGRVVVLTTLEVDSTVKPRDALRIGVKVNALACIEACIPVTAAASLELPVTEKPGPAANTKLFEEARAKQPRSFADSPYIAGSELHASHTRLPIADSGTFIAVLRIKPGHHIMSRAPGAEGLIPTRLFIESRDGILFHEEEQIWPPANTREIKDIGKVREYAGEISVRVPFKVADAKFPPGPVKLRALLQYQACADSGQCFAPEWAEGELRFEVVAAGGAAVTNPNPLVQAALAAEVPADRPQAPAGQTHDFQAIVWVFLGAFLGGVILNIMPCVLPVISIKIFAFMQQAGEHPGRVFRLGLMYGVGILFSFLVLASFMVALKAPWGGLMQQPSFLIGLSGVVLAFALSLFGLFEISLPGGAMDAAERATHGEGYGGAFMKGVMATALATPCTAPFLGWALGVLTQLPAPVMFGGIMTVGLGLAAPYVLLTAFPGWLRFLPKPGKWMVTFKELMGFVLLATVIWLLVNLSALSDVETLLAALVFLTAVGMACWFLAGVTPSASISRALTRWVAAAAILLLGWFYSPALFSKDWQQIPWQEWSPGRAQQLASDGYTVYIDYTASWCLTCQANKRIVLETDPVREKLSELGVIPIKADFTHYDERIQKELQQFGRNGVPLNIVFPAGRPDQPIVLPEILTQSTVLDALRQAGASQQKPALVRKVGSAQAAH